MKFESVNEVFKRFLRGFRFSNVVLLKRTTYENLWETSKRFLKGSRSPEVFQRFSRRFLVDISRIFSMLIEGKLSSIPDPLKDFLFSYVLHVTLRKSLDGS